MLAFSLITLSPSLTGFIFEEFFDFGKVGFLLIAVVDVSSMEDVFFTLCCGWMVSRVDR